MIPTNFIWGKIKKSCSRLPFKDDKKCADEEKTKTCQEIYPDSIFQFSMFHPLSDCFLRCKLTTIYDKQLYRGKFVCCFESWLVNHQSTICMIFVRAKIAGFFISFGVSWLHKEKLFLTTNYTISIFLNRVACEDKRCVLCQSYIVRKRRKLWRNNSLNAKKNQASLQIRSRSPCTGLDQRVLWWRHRWVTKHNPRSESVHQRSLRCLFQQTQWLWIVFHIRHFRFRFLKEW